MLGVRIGIVLADLQLSKYWSNICHPMRVGRRSLVAVGCAPDDLYTLKYRSATTWGRETFDLVDIKTVLTGVTENTR